MKSKNLDFDEKFYLDLYPDVKLAKRKFLTSGLKHWLKFGQKEGRVYSSKKIGEFRGLKPSVGNGIFAPVALSRYLFVDKFQLPKIIKTQEGTLLVLVPDLDRDLFFAGYKSFFSEIEKIRGLFLRVQIVVFSNKFDRDIFENDLKYEVSSKKEFESKPFIPDLVIAFDAKTNLYAQENLNLGEKTVYFCQDFEAGFHPLGSLYIWSLKSLWISKYLVISTPELADELRAHKLISTDAVCVIQPEIKTLGISKEPQKIIFGYFRPEYFNTRNLAEHIWQAIGEFCQKANGWTIYLVGTNGTNFEMKIGENRVVVLSKLRTSEYETILAKSYLVMSFIYSAHPGVLAFQTATSGIKTITNTYGLRGKSYWNELSSNFVPVDLVKEDLTSVLISAAKDFGTREPGEIKRVGSDDFVAFIEGAMNSVTV